MRPQKKRGHKLGPYWVNYNYSEVPIWNLKFRKRELWRQKIFAICIYRTRSSNAFRSIEKWNGNTSKHKYNKSIYWNEEVFRVSNGQVFERLTNVECKLLEQDKKIDNLFAKFDQEDKVTQKLFFDGQIWDSYNLIINIIKRAASKLLIIDNYIDDSILEMLSKKKKGVEVVILTSNNSNILKLDIQKFNKEYPILKVAKTDKFHDRFIIIDNKELYHCGASLKDLGKKCFGINRIEDVDYIDSLKKKVDF